MFSDAVISEELKTGFKIPPKPELLTEIEELTVRPEFNITDLAIPLSKDISLSSAVLQLVNSASFGLNRTICDISQAVCFMGVDQIKAIVAILRLREAYPMKSSMTLERFWDESLEIAQMMLFINQWLGKKYQPDALYSLGLFHDCGIAALAFKFEDYIEVLIKANDSPDLPLYELENQHYNTDHATIGYYIASSWHFPKQLCEQIRFHHDVEFVAANFPEEQRPYIAILHMAENILKQTKRYEECDCYRRDISKFLAWLEISDDEYQELVDDIEASLEA